MYAIIAVNCPTITPKPMAKKTPKHTKLNISLSKENNIHLGGYIPMLQFSPGFTTGHRSCPADIIHHLFTTIPPFPKYIKI